MVTQEETNGIKEMTVEELREFLQAIQENIIVLVEVGDGDG